MNSANLRMNHANAPKSNICAFLKQKKKRKRNHKYYKAGVFSYILNKFAWSWSVI